MPKISSSSDPSDPQPWFDFDFDSADLEVDIREANGLAAAGWTNASEQAEQDLVGNSIHAKSLNSEKDTEVHVLLIDLDGNLQFVPESEQPAVCYAHLAWYDPEADTLDQLTFTDP
jgi:hypothetical protein